MSHAGGLTAAGGAGGVWPAFTVAQWQELEHQAFIFKYMKAGIPVPPDLLAPIRLSLESISARLFHLPPLGYSSPYGKKYDPEPGRCRRTDGKKWRCAKDAYPDSKYCERHMNRTRNRSRKLVESKTTSHSVSTVASATSNASGSSQNPPLQSYGNQDGLYRKSNASQLQLESIPYGVCDKEYRGQHGHKPEPAKHSFIPEVSRSLTSIGSNSNASSEWCFPTAQITSYPISEPSTGTLLQFNRPQDYEPAVSVDAAMSKQQQEHYFFGMEFSSGIPMKQDHQSLQPLFDDWPKSRDFGSYTGDPKSDTKLHSTTQLSMSTPMAPSDFFSRRAHSPNDG